MKAILEVRIKKIDEEEYQVSGHSRQNMGFACTCPKQHVEAVLEEEIRKVKKYSNIEVKILQDDRQTKINGGV